MNIKEYNFFKDLSNGLKKNLFSKDLNSIEQLNFYKEVIEYNQNGYLTTKSMNFLLNVPYKYIEDFKAYDIDIKKILDNRMFNSQDYV